ncbi:MAG: hypothetical protein Q7T76_10205 [Ferruginibacter sp.]|nr:hypothetical protein [Ferruginibacter sp.]
MKNYLLAVLISSPVLLAAQKKVDLDRYKVRVQFRSLPAMQIDSSYHTYSVEVESTRMMQNFLTGLSPEKTVDLKGWRKLPEQGHLQIKIKLEDLLPESVSVKERVENIKNKSGQITGTRTLYQQEVVYSFAARAVITDYKGMHIIDEVLADRAYKQTFTSPEFAFKKLAEGYFLLNSLATTGDLYRHCVTRAMHFLNERITNNFGYEEVTANDVMWIVDSKKHPEYDAHRKAFRQLNDVLFAMAADQPLGNLRTELQPVIAYFDGIKKTYDTESKHDRKMRYASYYNLAVLYYYLDDPQSMMKEATGLILNDYDTRDGKKFEESANRLKNEFQRTNIYSRHFKIDPQTFKGPFEAQDQSLNNNTKVYQ